MRSARNWILLIATILFSFSLVPPVAAQGELTYASVLPLTGPFGGGGKEGAAGQKDCVDIINQEGGINGKRLKYVVEDGQYKLEVAMAAFQKIMETEYPLIFAAESAPMAKALGQDFKSRYKMLLTSASSSSELANKDKNPYSFVSGPTDGDQLGILLKYIAKQKRGARVAFFYSDSEFGKDPIKFGRLMCDRLRLKLVAEETVPLGAKDLKPQIMNLKSQEPDYVIFHGFLFDPVPQVIKACRDLGMKTNFMGTFYLSSKWLLDKLGPLGQGYMAVSPYTYWWNKEAPTIRKITDYTAKTYPDVKFRDIYYMRGFMSILLASECMLRADNAGQLNRQGVAKALQTIRNFNSGGLSAPWTIHNNRFPIAKVWEAKPEKGIYEPASDWIRLDRY